MGEAPQAEMLVQAGLAFYTKEETTLGTLHVSPGHWKEVLGVRAVPDEERAVWKS
jgi:hypothetical protein